MPNLDLSLTFLAFNLIGLSIWRQPVYNGDAKSFEARETWRKRVWHSYQHHKSADELLSVTSEGTVMIGSVYIHERHFKV